MTALALSLFVASDDPATMQRALESLQRVSLGLVMDGAEVVLTLSPYVAEDEDEEAEAGSE